MRLGVLLHRVVEVVRRDERDAEGSGERDLFREHAALIGDAVILELHEEPVGTEDVAVAPRGLLGSAILPGEQQRRQLARQTSREADDAFRVLGEELLVHAGPVVEALEIGRGHELQEVAVPGLVLGEQREVVVLLLVLARVPLEPRPRRDVRLDADDRLDARGAPGLEEAERPEHGSVIRHGHRRHAVTRGLREDRGRLGVELRRLDAGGAVEQRVLGVDVEVDEARLVGHRRWSGLLQRVIHRPSGGLWINLHPCDSAGASRYARPLGPSRLQVAMPRR